MSGPTTAKARADWERRFRARGSRFVSVRLSPRAGHLLDALAAQHNCGNRDVIEGLLLGTIERAIPEAIAKAMREHGLSESEARYVVENGIAA